MPAPRGKDASQDDRVAAAYLNEAEEIAKKIAADAGAPADADRVGEKENLRLWGQSDPAVDYESLYEQLLNGGLPPEALEQLAIAEERPELAPLYGQPQEPDLADLLARLAEYPFRLGLVVDHTDDLKEQAALAEHYDRLWQQSMPAPVAPAAPEMAPAPLQRAPDAPMPPPAPSMGAMPDVMPPMESPTPLPGMGAAPMPQMMPPGGAP